MTRSPYSHDEPPVFGVIESEMIENGTGDYNLHISKLRDREKIRHCAPSIQYKEANDENNRFGDEMSRDIAILGIQCKSR